MFIAGATVVVPAAFLWFAGQPQYASKAAIVGFLFVFLTLLPVLRDDAIPGGSFGTTCMFDADGVLLESEWQGDGLHHSVRIKSRRIKDVIAGETAYTIVLRGRRNLPIEYAAFANEGQRKEFEELSRGWLDASRRGRGSGAAS